MEEPYPYSLKKPIESQITSLGGILFFASMLAPIAALGNSNHLSINTTQDLFNTVQSAFRIVRPDPNCPTIQTSTNREDYCERLDQIACSQEPAIRFDRTGSVIMPPRTQVIGTSQAGNRNSSRAPDPDLMPDSIFNSISESISQSISGRIDPIISRDERYFREIFPNARTSENLANCLKRTIVVFTSANRNQFIHHENTRSPYNYSDRADFNRLRQQQVNRYLGDECRLGDRSRLSELITLPGFRSLREQIDNDLMSAASQSESMLQVRRLFPDIKSAAVRTIEMSRRIPEAQKAEMIRRISGTEIGSCSPQSASIFGEPASIGIRGDGGGVIRICPATVASCRSDFCIARTLAHELSHLFDYCNYHFEEPRKRTGQDAITRTHPLGHTLACFQRQHGTGRLSNDFNFCRSNNGFNELFCDHVGSTIVANYFADRRDLTTDDIRRGFSNSFVCYHPINSRSNISNTYPSDPQRIRGIMNTPRVRDLMNCGDERNRDADCDI